MFAIIARQRLLVLLLDGLGAVNRRRPLTTTATKTASHMEEAACGTAAWRRPHAGAALLHVRRGGCHAAACTAKTGCVRCPPRCARVAQAHAARK